MHDHRLRVVAAEPHRRRGGGSTAPAGPRQAKRSTTSMFSMKPSGGLTAALAAPSSSSASFRSAISSSRPGYKLLLRELMEDGIGGVEVHRRPAEAAAELLAQYRLHCCAGTRRRPAASLGIVTHDDAIDVITRGSDRRPAKRQGGVTPLRERLPGSELLQDLAQPGAVARGALHRRTRQFTC